MKLYLNEGTLVEVDAAGIGKLLIFTVTDLPYLIREGWGIYRSLNIALVSQYPTPYLWKLSERIIEPLPVYKHLGISQFTKKLSDQYFYSNSWLFENDLWKNKVVIKNKTSHQCQIASAIKLFQFKYPGSIATLKKQ